MPHRNSALLAEEVDRICDSPVFRRAKIQTKLLRYLAGESAAGRGNELNQYLIATEGMGLPETFDPTTDATVRVWGVRLRRMLANYYRGPGSQSAVRVKFPERSFCPHLEFRGTDAADSHEADKLPTVAVMVFRGIGLRGSWRHYPAVLAENLMAALTAMQSVEAIGPFRRLPSAGDSAFASPQANFTLDGSVEAMPSGLRLRARLLRRSTGGACWAETFETKIRGDRIPRADLPAAARLAAVLGDDFGVIRREVLLASLGKPVESLSSLETIMLVWRSWSSMAPRDITEARRAMRCAVQRPRASPLVKAFASLNLFDSWATTKRLHTPLPPGLMRLAEEARRADPGNAWVLLANLYASIAAGHTGQAERWMRQIDKRRATTPALRLSFACARLAYGLGKADDALRIWRKAMRETPSPLAIFFVGPAIHALRGRHWREALAMLDQAANCDFPLCPALRAAALAGAGKKAAARRELAELRKIFPDCSSVAAEVLARSTDPSCHRVIHRNLTPLAPDLFPAKTSGAA